MMRVAAVLPPDVGMPFVNRLDAETDRLWRQARGNGGREPRAAYAADALVALANGTAQTPPGRSDLVLVCDVRAWRRGHIHRGEPCHIVGGGPVPVTVAKDLAEDAFVKAVTHDGMRIETVAHIGRHLPAELRTALELGPPPEFDGATCGDEVCGRRYGLEWDHRDPVANGGLTSYANLQPWCWRHHRDKTERHRAAGLLTSSRRREQPEPDPP